MRARALVFGGALSLFSLLVCATILGAQERRVMPDTLTSDERDIAMQLVGGLMEAQADTLPVYLVDVELVRDKDDPDNRRALVTHYRYAGDLAVFTLLDLASQQIIQSDSVPNVPVPLSATEVDLARELALSDDAVRAAIGDRLDDLVVEPLLTRTVDPDDPLFGHRAVRLLFRIGRSYLEEPVVTVDLTTRQVLIGG